MLNTCYQFCRCFKAVTDAQKPFLKELFPPQDLICERHLICSDVRQHIISQKHVLVSFCLSKMEPSMFLCIVAFLNKNHNFQKIFKSIMHLRFVIRIILLSNSYSRISQ